MGKPELELRLDQDGTIVAGSKLGGTLVVRAQGALRARSARVALAWTASASGSAKSGGQVEWRSGPIDLAASETVSLPFVLDVPASPRTFRGQLVSVDWTARAALVGATPAIRPVAGDVVVAGVHEGAAPAAGYRGEVAAPALVEDEPRRARQGASVGLRIARSISILLCCTGVIVLGARGGMTSLLFLVLSCVAVLLVSLILAPLLARSAMRSLGDPCVQVSSSRLAPGDRLDLAITVDATQWQDVERIVAKVCRVEVAPSTASTGPREHWMRGDLVELCRGITFQPGVPRRFTAKLRVPRDATPGFALAGASGIYAVRWQAVVLFVIPRTGADRVAAVELDVVDDGSVTV